MIKQFTFGVIILIGLTGCQVFSPQAAPTGNIITPNSGVAASTAVPTHLPTDPLAGELELPTVESPHSTERALEEVAATSSPEDRQAVETALPAPSSIRVETLPDSSRYSWVPWVSGLENPVGIANARDGSGRVFILEQPGRIRVVDQGVLLADSFLDISAQVGCCGERGLLGLAFHPQYGRNGFFYVNYTDKKGDTVIARFQVSANQVNRADPASETRLLSIQQPFPNHNGGQVAFGPDGYLYLGLGDGGSAGDPQGNGQATDTLLGKILRLDVDQGEPYSIPPGNPFSSGGGLPEVWAFGLRNPWRFSFDPMNGELYIADVGQNQWEEVNYVPAGADAGWNFGWNFREGAHQFKGSPPGELTLIDPVAEYNHQEGCSVTGGVVYRGKTMPDLQGVYLYGDYCSGQIWGLLPTPGGWENAVLFDLDMNITAFGTDEDGEVYLSAYAGTIYRLESQAGTLDPSSVRFAVIGDYGLAGPAEAETARLVLSWEPDIILTTGDNNYPDGEAATIDANIGQYYHSYIGSYEGAYGLGANKNRFFPTLGNHDWNTAAANAYFEYFSLPGNERYYEFVWGPVHFFALDSDSREPDGVGRSSLQAQWLQESLAASTSPWQLVFMHHPPYSSGLHGSVEWMRWSFSDWGADAVLAGHDHLYERLEIGEIPYFINGLGGGPIYYFDQIQAESRVRFGADHGAMLGEADPDKLWFQFITREGDVIDEFTLTR